METDDSAIKNGLPPVVQRRIFFAMDAEMAFLMVNQAQAAHVELVYDLFVGTGSILVSAAHFGAMTMGADMDIRVLHDRGSDCNYSLPMPIALLRANNNILWRPGLNEVISCKIAWCWR
ncbi:hypothetical protein CRYUN_Cryun04dG0091100 [Craigia yunnanensis]